MITTKTTYGNGARSALAPQSIMAMNRELLGNVIVGRKTLGNVKFNAAFGAALSAMANGSDYATDAQTARDLARSIEAKSVAGKVKRVATTALAIGTLVFALRGSAVADPGDELLKSDTSYVDQNSGVRIDGIEVAVNEEGIKIGAAGDGLNVPEQNDNPFGSRNVDATVFATDSLEIKRLDSLKALTFDEGSLVTLDSLREVAVAKHLEEAKADSLAKADADENADLEARRFTPLPGSEAAKVEPKVGTGIVPAEKPVEKSEGTEFEMAEENEAPAEDEGAAVSGNIEVGITNKWTGNHFKNGMVMEKSSISSAILAKLQEDGFGTIKKSDVPLIAEDLDNASKTIAEINGIADRNVVKQGISLTIPEDLMKDLWENIAAKLPVTSMDEEAAPEKKTETGNKSSGTSNKGTGGTSKKGTPGTSGTNMQPKVEASKLNERAIADSTTIADLTNMLERSNRAKDSTLHVMDSTYAAKLAEVTEAAKFGDKDYLLIAAGLLAMAGIGFGLGRSGRKKEPAVHVAAASAGHAGAEPEQYDDTL